MANVEDEFGTFGDDNEIRVSTFGSVLLGNLSFS